MAIQTNAGSGRFDFGSSNTNISTGSSIGGAASGGLTGGSSTIYTGNKAVVDGHMASAQVESVDLSDLITGTNGPLVDYMSPDMADRMGIGQGTEAGTKPPIPQPKDLSTEERHRIQDSLDEFARTHRNPVGGEVEGPYTMDLPTEERLREQRILDYIRKRNGALAGGELGDDVPKPPYTMDLPDDVRRRDEQIFEEIKRRLREQTGKDGNNTFNPDANPTPYTEPQRMDLPPELDPRRRTGMATFNPDANPTAHTMPQRPQQMDLPPELDPSRRTGMATFNPDANPTPHTQPQQMDLPPELDPSRRTGLAPAPEPKPLEEAPEGFGDLLYRHDIYPGRGNNSQYR